MTISPVWQPLVESLQWFVDRVCSDSKLPCLHLRRLLVPPMLDVVVPFPWISPASPPVFVVLLAIVVFEFHPAIFLRRHSQLR